MRQMTFLAFLLCGVIPCVGVLYLNHVRAALAGPIQVCGTKASGRHLCQCEKTTINCDHEDLHTTNVVPVQDTKSHKHPVTVLSMERCTLPGLFKGKIIPGHERTLKKLDFNHNFITFIQNRVFENMESLEELNLSWNHIHHLSEEMFAELDFSLISLKLDGNYLRNLTDSVFERLTSLKYLSLTENPLLHLSNRTFLGLHSLVELEMDHTQLSTIGKDWFLGLTNLQTLSMRRGRFLVVPSFHGLVNLQSLDLSENPITSINAYAFRGLSYLSHIFLKNMTHLWSIEDCAFCGLHKLKQLVIYNCSILKFVDPEAFGKHNYFENAIEVIDFEANDLTTLYGDLLPWENVTSVKLGANPWHCDCRIAWMNNPKLRYQSVMPTCFSPENLKHIQVNMLHKEELCHGNTLVSRFTGKIFVPITIIFLIAGTLTLAWYLWLSKLHRQKLKTVFYRPQLPKYGYRNLAMNSDIDDIVFDATETKKTFTKHSSEPVQL